MNEKTLNWIPANKRLPESGQEVFACYYDPVIEDWQYEVLTYFRKGDQLDNEQLPTGAGNEVLLDALINPSTELAVEDGFYIFDSCGKKYCSWRKHADIISHWMLPVPPWVVERGDNRDPLTINELQEMDGEPVWCVDGDGNECYCLVNIKTEECVSNDADAWDFAFYGMKYSDNDGLHPMGWLAYRTKRKG